MCDFFFHPTHFFLACVIFWLRQAHFSMFSRCYYFHSFYIFFCSVIHCSSQCAHRLWLSFIAWSTWSSSCVGRDTPFLLSPHLLYFFITTIVTLLVLFLIEDKLLFFGLGVTGEPATYFIYTLAARSESVDFVLATSTAKQVPTWCLPMCGAANTIPKTWNCCDGRHFGTVWCSVCQILPALAATLSNSVNQL